MATTNLGLTQYLATDKIDFLTKYNGDMSKIDTAVGKPSTLTTTNKTSVVPAINELNANIGTVANLTTSNKTSLVVASNEILNEGRSGWSLLLNGDKLTYSSASAPTFVCNTLNSASVAKDFRGYISVGMKLRLTQSSTAKYFFVTAITSNSITLYGGTDYTLTNAAITNVCYSMVKAPHGFPLNPNKWSQSIVVTTNSSHSVTANIWKDTNIKLKIPVGDWNIEADYAVSARNIASQWGAILWTCFLPSPTNSSTMSAVIGSDVVSSADCNGRIHLSDNVRIESETVYTLHLKTMFTLDTVSVDAINGYNVFKATCVYL